MQKWYEWLEYVKRKDEKKKMEEMHQHRVEQMIQSAEESAGLLHKIRKKADALDGRSTDLGERRRRCKVFGPL